MVDPVPTGALAALSAGFSNTTWNGQTLPVALDPFGFPGCDLLQSAEFTFIGNQASLPIPLSTSFAGLTVYYQGGVLEPGVAQPLGTTAGAALTAGIR